MDTVVQQKRFEYFSRNGKAWSEWFNYSGEKYKWQLKGKLRNEYRAILASSEKN